MKMIELHSFTLNINKIDVILHFTCVCSFLVGPCVVLWALKGDCSSIDVRQLCDLKF